MVGGKGAAEKRLAQRCRRTGLDMREIISGHSTTSSSNGSIGPWDSQPVWRGSAFPTGLDVWPSRDGDLHLSRLGFREDCFRPCHLGQMKRFEVEFERAQQVTCQC
jgi:hypothetical protein